MLFIASLFILKILNFFPDYCDHVGKVDKKVMLNFKVFDVINFEKNNCNTDIALYLIK